MQRFGALGVKQLCVNVTGSTRSVEQVSLNVRVAQMCKIPKTYSEHCTLPHDINQQFFQLRASLRLFGDGTHWKLVIDKSARSRRRVARTFTAAWHSLSLPVTR